MLQYLVWLTTLLILPALSDPYVSSLCILPTARIVCEFYQLPNVLNSNAYCYITISDGAETCYYYPSTGYECEYGTPQDPMYRNMSACNYMGMPLLCRSNVAGAFANPMGITFQRN